MDLALCLAPGLLFLIEAGVVLLVLARLGERVPEWVATLGVGLVFVFLAPVLVGGRVLLPLDLLAGPPPFAELPRTERPANPLQGDLVTQITPALAQVRGAVRRGEWPLWNASAGAGESLLGRPAAQVLQPLQLAALPLPLERAAGLVAALKLYFAFLFTFLFLRRRELGSLAAVFGALAFGASSYVVSWLGWPAATVAAWLPFALLAVDRATAAEPRKTDLLLLAAAVFALATAGDDDAARAVFVFVAAFAVLRLGDLVPATRPRGLGRLAAAGLVGLSLASPVLLARQSFLADSLTRARIDGFVDNREKNDPLGLWSFDSGEKRATWVEGLGRRLLPSIAPDALGNNRAGAYWGAANVNEDGGGFVGTAVLLVVLAGTVLPGRGPRPRETRFFAFALLAAVLLVARPPVLVELADHWASPSLHRHGLVVAAFALAALGALALERVRREGLARPAVVVALAVTLGGLLLGAHSAYPPPEAAGETIPRGRTLALQLGTLATVSAALGLARRRPRALVLVPAIAFAELALLGLPVNRPGLAEQYFPTPPAVGFLAGRLGPGERLVAQGDSFPAETPALYGLADVRVAGADHPAFYTRLIAPLVPPRLGRFDWTRRLDHPLLDLLGVRYVLAQPGAEIPAGLVTLFSDSTGVVLERPRALPLAFLPAAADVYDPKAGPWERWTAANPDFRAKSLVRDALDGAATWRARRPGRATLELVRGTPPRVAARVEAGEPRLLATSIFGDPGWRAVVAGRAAAVTRSNGPLLALWVPAGRHDVELLYRPAELVAGLALAALGLALGGAWLLAPRETSP